MTDGKDYRHSIRFIPERCKGCTHCLRACPTGAIRVKDGTAQIIQEKCIACGECLRVCPNDAVTTNSDSLAKIEDYDYKIAIPSSPFFGQFREGVKPETLVQALKEIGFDEVYEEALGGEFLSYAIRKEIDNKKVSGPLISTTCPAIIRLIQVKYPSLLDNLLPLSPPHEVTAELVLKEKSDMPREKLGLFSIAPCPAQVVAARSPEGKENSTLDGVISIEEVYNKVMGLLPDLEEKSEFHGTKLGLNWGRREGEIEAVDAGYRIIAVDGVRTVQRIFKDLEEGRLQEVEYLEARSCAEGCSGGVLTAEDPPITKYRLQNIDEEDLGPLPYDEEEILALYEERIFTLDKAIEPRPTLHLHDNLDQALAIMEKADEVMHVLPGLDCAACGYPSCQAFAEDVAQEKIAITGCPLLEEIPEELEKETKQ
ncbi:MAG: [Fe-Fe] hydrogenase large subunit C-terminal domain-containing protein [Candidatus Acetothermia bacterium]